MYIHFEQLNLISIDPGLRDNQMVLKLLDFGASYLPSSNCIFLFPWNLCHIYPYTYQQTELRSDSRKVTESCISNVYVILSYMQLATPSSVYCPQTLPFSGSIYHLWSIQHFPGSRWSLMIAKPLLKSATHTHTRTHPLHLKPEIKGAL